MAPPKSGAAVPPACEDREIRICIHACSRIQESRGYPLFLIIEFQYTHKSSNWDYGFIYFDMAIADDER